MREVPDRVYELLGGAFIEHEAHQVLREAEKQGGYRPGDVVPLGDPLGEVLAWLWETSPTEAMSLLGDFMAQLRHWDELADRKAPNRIRLDDVLRFLPATMPEGFTDSRALVAQARREVPKFFSNDDLNS